MRAMMFSPFTMALRNLARRPLRTLFTALGVAIGISAIIAIVGISAGMESSWEKALKARGTDLVVSSKSSGMMPTPMDMELTARVAASPGVADATGILWQQLSIEDGPMVVVSGREWGGFGWNNLKIVRGRLPRDAAEKAVVLGLTAAEILGKNLGDTVQIELEEFEVVGVIDGGAVVENGSIAVSLPWLQTACGLTGKISFINVRLSQPVSEAAARDIGRRIEAAVPGVRATLAGETLAASRSFQMMRAGSWATSLLATLAGVFGVMNTMLMAVFERTREIGILAALGWRRGKIIAIIMIESVALCLSGFLLGTAMGLLMLAGLARSPLLRGTLEPQVSTNLLLGALAVSILVGVVSSIYPGWKSANTPPGVALQAP